MRYFDAWVSNERLVLDEPTDLAEGTFLELVPTDDVLNNGGDLLDLEGRAALALALEAADAEINAGATIDLAEAMAELRAEHSDASSEWRSEELSTGAIAPELRNANHTMRFFDACVRNGRLVLDAPTDLDEATIVELVSTDDVLSNGGDLLDADERAALDRDLGALIAEADEKVPLAEAMAELRANHSRRSRHQRRRDLNRP